MYKDQEEKKMEGVGPDKKCQGGKMIFKNSNMYIYTVRNSIIIIFSIN